MIIGVTGPRPGKPWSFPYGESKAKQLITSWLLHQLADVCPDKARTGMALGVDQWFAELCIKLDIPFVADVPFEGQELAWPLESQQKYWEIRDKACDVVIVSERPVRMTNYEITERMFKRNEHIVNNCDLLLAVWNGARGGTANCVNYARQVDREIRRLKEW